MKRYFKKICAIILCVSLILTAMPVIQTVSAAQVDTASISAPKQETQEAYILDEIEQRREENVKHFRMSDGSVVAAVYPYDVHYKNAENILCDIDNSLVSQNDGGNDVLANKNNVLSVKFMKKSNPNKLYTIDKGDYKIKVALEGAEKVELKNVTTEDNALQNKFELENIQSKVLYSDIFNNTDIEYILNSTKLKENIILKDKVDYNSLVYTYHINTSFEAIQKDSKTIEFCDADGNTIIHLSAPVLWDADGNYSDELSLEILETKNSKATVKLSWEIPENAVYPVTIDPTLVPAYKATNVKDTTAVYANQGAVNTGYLNTYYMRIGKKTELGNAEVAGAVYADIPSTIPATARIVNASVGVAFYDIQGPSKDSGITLSAYQITEDWNTQNINEDTILYYDSPDERDTPYIADESLDYERVVDTESYTSSYQTFDITRAAQDWMHNNNNYGIMLRMDYEYVAENNYLMLFSSDHDVNSPYFVFSYIDTTGVEDYYSYHTQSLGYAGTGYVNDLTGNLTVVNEVFNSGSSLMPLSVSLIYNLSNVDNDSAPYGRGWKLNWNQKIDKSVKSNYDNTQYLKYTDGDGTEHYFTSDSSTDTWTNEINSDIKINSASSSNDYIMTDSSGITRYFTRDGSLDEWYLYRTEDSYGNYIQVILDNDNLNRVEKVYTSTGDVVDFVYSEFGFLTDIKYYEGDTAKIIEVDYNNYVTPHNNGISDIVFADGTYVQYHYYNNTSHISKAIDISGQSIVYDYIDEVATRVERVAEYSDTNLLGAEMTVQYDTTSTVFTDVTNNRKYLYTFAQNGTLKSVVDTTVNDGNGYAQYYEYNNGNTTETTGMGNLTFISKTQKNTVNILRNHSFEESGWHNFTTWGEECTTATGEYTTEKSFIGARSYKITRPTSSNCSRALGFYYLYLEGGITYTFSAYVNTSGMTSNGGGVSLLFSDADIRHESEFITEAKDEWQRLSLTFTTTESDTVNLCMNLSDATGSVYFDNVQLEVGDLSDYNILENAGFENAVGTEGYRWISYGSAINFVTEDKASGSYSAKLNGAVNSTVEYLQFVNIPEGKNGDTYVASAFAKAHSVPAEGWQFSLLVRFTKDGDTVNEENIEFNSYTTQWQKVAGAAKATGDYDTIQFWLLYYRNCNTVYFDNAQLIKDTFGTSYTYDEDGNLISTVDLEGKAEYTFKYDGNNQLIKENSISGGKILYSYNSSKKQQLDLVTAGGNSTYLDYDSNGNAVTSSTYGSGLVDGTYYYIQNVHNSRYLTAVDLGHSYGKDANIAQFSESSSQRWKVIKNSDGSYSLSCECEPDKLLSLEFDSLYSELDLILFAPGGRQYQKFDLVKKHGNIYSLVIHEAPEWAVDVSEIDSYIYSAHFGEIQQFAFIPVRGNHSADNPAIISSATYTENGRNTESITDSRGNTTSYTYHSTLNHILSQTAPNGAVTSYAYKDNSYLLSSVTNGSSTVSYNYDSAKRLSSITSPSGTKYNFSYNSFGRTTDTKIGTRVLSSNVYDDTKGLLDYTTYGNGTVVDYSYDNLGRLTDTEINGTLRYKRIYDGSSRLIELSDVVNSRKIKYDYDILDRAVGQRLVDTATNKVYASLGIRYDNAKNRVSGYDVNIEGINKATDFVYGENKVDPEIITAVKHNNNTSLTYGYDTLNRLTSRTLAAANNFTTEYTYVAGRTKGATEDNPTLTTTLVKTVKNGNDTLEYTYDNMGNIISVSKNGTVVESYTYDSLNQLTSYTKDGTVYGYTYDAGGNISTTRENGVIVNRYRYRNSEWKDLLTAYNSTNIHYDEIGNPLDWMGDLVFTWSNGRQLTAIRDDVYTKDYRYTYDAEGLRTSKSINGVTTDYYWLNGMLQAQKTGSEYLVFLYDENGIAYGLLLKNGATEEYYYYVFNAQGDVIGILDSQGTQVVEYIYNPWGEILSTTGTLKDTIGQKNPLRYRGYYYDNETGFYYLNSRYYDPEVGRFINADGYVQTPNGDITSTNMYAYCGNNFVNRYDLSGYFWAWIKTTVKTVLAVAVTAVVIVAAVTMPSKEEHYARNDKQKDLIPDKPQDIIDNKNEWIRKSDSANIYHKHTKGEQGEDARNNVKYMSSDGHLEVIICNPDKDNAYIVTDPYNYGTYNFGTNWFSHFFKDVLPYWFWGNSSEDSRVGHAWDRITGAKL